MNFPEVWHLEQKHKAIHLESFLNNDVTASKLSLKQPIAKMVRIRICKFLVNFQCSELISFLMFQISILTPETSTLELENIINESDYYCCEDFNLTEVLTRNFIDGFLKCGSFSCVQTENTRDDDCFLISRNKLLLRLHRDSLYSLQAVELSSLKNRSVGEFFGKVPISSLTSCIEL